MQTDKQEVNVEKDGPKEGQSNNKPKGKWHKPRQRAPMLSPDVPIYTEAQLNNFTVTQLQSIAKAEGVRQYWSSPRKGLIIEIIKQQLRRGARIESVGIIETTPEHHGYVRNLKQHLCASKSDPFIPVQLMRQFGLYSGLEVKGALRQPRGGDKHLVMNEILKVEDGEPDKLKERVAYEKLTALFPEDRLFLEMPGEKGNDYTRRVIDLVTPIGKGQRGLIVAPPRVGKTVLMKKMVQSIEKNHPEVKVIVLLIDERPEEVTDMIESVSAQIISSTFDEKPAQHIQVANTALNRSKVLVENGEDVVLFIDSITRLTRAYNSTKGNNSRMMSGGIDSDALQKAKQFFGTARNIENGGSLTIFGTTLVETGSRMDQVIFEEFKGTGNMELFLDREIASQRLYPAVNIIKSGTRKDELFMTPEEYEITQKVRKTLNTMIPKDALLHLIEKFDKFKTNAEFLMAIKNAVGGYVN
jgi:transcription termination factor Rho